MGKVSQVDQVNSSTQFDDTLSVLDAETSSVNLETDLNFIRSAIKQITGELSWLTLPVSTIKQLASQIGVVKLVTYYRSEYQSVFVPNTRNYATLSAAGSYPSEVIALTDTSRGAIAAELATVSGANHSLAQASSESNLVLIRDADTLEVITDIGGETVYGLLQVALGSIDGSAFSGAGINSAQISLVSRDRLTGNLQEANVLYVQNRNIQYSFHKREAFTDIEEDAFSQSVTFLAG